jgi:hypothetical protein
VEFDTGKGTVELSDVPEVVIDSSVEELPRVVAGWPELLVSTEEVIITVLKMVMTLG